MPTIRNETDFAFEEWKALYEREPTWGPVEWKHLRSAVKRLGDRFRSHWQAYMASQDPFYRGHTPRLFIANLEYWAPPKVTTKDEYGWVKWCEHRRPNTEPDPSCIYCQARAEQC